MIKFENLNIWDKILIPNYYCELLPSRCVEVTSFNIPHNIVHWKRKDIFGGTCHSGVYLYEIEKIIEHHKKF